MFDDLMVWKLFLENFNGVSYILDKDWVSNVDLQLFRQCRRRQYTAYMSEWLWCLFYGQMVLFSMAKEMA
jgi:hypothetical protein